MNRRDFVRLGCAAVIASGAAAMWPVFAQSRALGQVPRLLQHPAAALEPNAAGRAADFNLQIAPMMTELAPQVVISTIALQQQSQR